MVAVAGRTVAGGRSSTIAGFIDSRREVAARCENLLLGACSAPDRLYSPNEGRPRGVVIPRLRIPRAEGLRCWAARSRRFLCSRRRFLGALVPRPWRRLAPIVSLTFDDGTADEYAARRCSLNTGSTRRSTSTATTSALAFILTWNQPSGPRRGRERDRRSHPRSRRPDHRQLDRGPPSGLVTTPRR